MGPEEIKKLAFSTFKGEVFTSLQVPSNQQDLVAMIFLPLALMRSGAREKLMEEKPAMFYANMSDASPRAINGFPMFFKMGYLNEQKTKEFTEAYNNIKGAAEKANG